MEYITVKILDDTLKSRQICLVTSTIQLIYLAQGDLSCLYLIYKINQQIFSMTDYLINGHLVSKWRAANLAALLWPIDHK